MGNNISIIKGTGGVPRSLPGEDHISGILMYLANANLPAGFSTTDRIKLIGALEDAEDLGIVDTSLSWEILALHYHISEAFRVNPALRLYVGLYETPGTTWDFVEIKTMQSYAEGKIRQIAVYAYQKDLAAGELTALQGVATALDEVFTPLQILYIPRIAAIAGLITSLVTTGLRNVSVIIGQGGTGDRGKDIYDLAVNSTNLYSVGLAGLAIGHLSLAKVHESIAWVKAFPSGISVPAFSDGTLVKNVSSAVLAALDEKHYLFLQYHGGIAGSWWNDSWTMDLGTSDYAYIEANRSMDKAIRGIRTYLVPELSGSIYIDGSTGKLNQDDVAYLQTVSGKALEDMEKARELSGYLVSIDPDQNVLSTSEIEIVVQKVGVGVMRKFKVYIKNVEKLT
jgi:hypothetical protein